eukprot:g5003.t1
MNAEDQTDLALQISANEKLTKWYPKKNPVVFLNEATLTNPASAYESASVLALHQKQGLLSAQAMCFVPANLWFYHVRIAKEQQLTRTQLNKMKVDDTIGHDFYVGPDTGIPSTVEAFQQKLRSRMRQYSTPIAFAFDDDEATFWADSYPKWLADLDPAQSEWEFLRRNTGLRKLWLGVDFGNAPVNVLCMRVKQCPKYSAREAVFEFLADGREWRQVFSTKYLFDLSAELLQSRAVEKKREIGLGDPDIDGPLQDSMMQAILETNGEAASYQANLTTPRIVYEPPPTFFNFDLTADDGKEAGGGGSIYADLQQLWSGIVNEKLLSAGYRIDAGGSGFAAGAAAGAAKEFTQNLALNIYHGQPVASQVTGAEIEVPWWVRVSPRLSRASLGLSAGTYTRYAVEEKSVLWRVEPVFHGVDRERLTALHARETESYTKRGFLPPQPLAGNGDKWVVYELEFYADASCETQPLRGENVIASGYDDFHFPEYAFDGLTELEDRFGRVEPEGRYWIDTGKAVRINKQQIRAVESDKVHVSKSYAPDPIWAATDAAEAAATAAGVSSSSQMMNSGASASWSPVYTALQNAEFANEELPASLANPERFDVPYIPWIGVDLGSEAFQPAWSSLSKSRPSSSKTVKCMRLRQSGVRSEQATSVVLATFDNARKMWSAVATYHDLGGESWQTRPRPVNSMWRVVYLQEERAAAERRNTEHERNPGEARRVNQARLVSELSDNPRKEECDSRANIVRQRNQDLTRRRSWGIAELEFYSDPECTQLFPVAQD